MDKHSVIAGTTVWQRAGTNATFLNNPSATHHSACSWARSDALGLGLLASFRERPVRFPMAA
jgi:hypothetical protein